MPIIDLMKDYIKSPSRNKIVFHSDVISDIVPVNLGLRLSETIYNFNEIDKIPMRISKELDIILNTYATQHDVYGRYLAIENLGILFESELKLDFTRMLDSYSQNSVLFVKWDGEIDADNIYFLTKENGIKIYIKNLSHIAI